MAGTLAWYACLNRGGRRVSLGIQDSPEEEMRLPTLAGTYVAWELSEMSIAPGPEAIVRDLASDGEAGITVVGGITGLVLWSRGDLIATSPSAIEYAKPVGRGRARATLDNGDIARRSLALSRNGRYAYWLNAGQPRMYELPR